MKTVALYIIFSLGLCGMLMAQDNTLAGTTWLGSLKLPGAALRLGISLDSTDNQRLYALLTSIDQGGVEIPMDSAIYQGDTLDLKSARLNMHIRGQVDLEAGTWTTLFKQGPAILPLVFHRVDGLPALNRPQEPSPPYPYRVEEVIYENSESGNRIGATLTIPEGAGPFPAVLLMTGSGPQNRDQELMGHKTFKVLADYLTRQGIVVLRYDDRGVGKSTGDFSRATWTDFIDDALCGVEYLAAHKAVDPQRLGVCGHSEGGTLAPMVSGYSSQVKFVIMMAGAGMPWDQLSLYQKKQAWARAGMSQADMDLSTRWHDQVTSILRSDMEKEAAEAAIIKLYNAHTDEELERMQKTPENLEYEISILLSPWWREACRTDIREELLYVECPVLAINGDKDLQVPADENLDIIREALEEGPCEDFQVEKLPGLNHLFQTAGSGEVTEYGQIEETMAPAAMERIARFIREH